MRGFDSLCCARDLHGPDFLHPDPGLNSPTSGGVILLKIGRRKMPGSNSGRACRPSRSEFSRGFS